MDSSIPSFGLNILCIWVIVLDLDEFIFIVKGHQGHVLLGGILDERKLLARVGIDDSGGINSKIKDALDFSLHKYIYDYIMYTKLISEFLD